MAASQIPAEYREIVYFMEEGIPFNKHLGLVVEHLEPGKCRLKLPWKEHFIGDAMRPALHGGVTSAMLDVAGGCACFTMIKLPESRLSTVDLRIDYLLPGPPKDLFVTAEVIRMGNRVATVTMELRAGSPESEDIIATGRGVYSVRRAE
jgi:uncharacterized protein (TIGR00369 family)